MQALGSYRGGKMLFLGLSTGLGSTLIAGGSIEPVELGHVPYKKSTNKDYVGKRALEKRGKKTWRRHVEDVVADLIAAFEPDDVVLGGGNVKKLKQLPPGCRAGDNAEAFAGRFRLWEEARLRRREGMRPGIQVGIASDHGGFALKEEAVGRLRAAGHEVVDFGAHALHEDDDYPDFVIPLGRAVAAGTVERRVAIGAPQGVAAEVRVRTELGGGHREGAARRSPGPDLIGAGIDLRVLGPRSHRPHAHRPISCERTLFRVTGGAAMSAKAQAAEPRVDPARLVSVTDTVYRDVYIERARMFRGELISPEDFGRIERQQADLPGLPLTIARALQRENWAQVQELTVRGLGSPPRSSWQTT